MKRLLSVALMVLVSLVGMVAVSHAGEDRSDSKHHHAIAKHADGSPRVACSAYYRSPGQPQDVLSHRKSKSRDQATGVCSTGFHMANLFEIVDTSNLQYATGLPDAFSDINCGIDDLRDGPSAIDFGWVRTGYASTPDPTSDPYASLNCNNESISTEAEWGTVVRLYDTVTASKMNSEWVGICARQCSQESHVWCVQN